MKRRKFYRAECIGRNPNQWRVRHIKSGYVVLPCGLMATVNRATAETWARILDRLAPHTCPREAAQALIAAGVPQAWHEIMMSHSPFRD